MSGGEPAPGDQLGPYRIESALGEGATGIVFLAVREPEGQAVALKVLRAELARDPVYTRRFHREARAAREVQHEHLVPVLDAGTAGGRHYLAMRHVNGRSLAERLRREGPLRLQDVVRLAAEVAAALDALHRSGIVHRDVKPANILLDQAGSAALTDYGLAKGRAYTVLTRPGQILGTVDYLAPEVIRGEAASAASDVYALGCVSFVCLAGAPPFASDNPFQVAAAHLGEQPPDPCADRDDVPPAMSAAVLVALAKAPESRPPTARAYALALLRASAGPA